MEDLSKDNSKLVKKFGAKPINTIKKLPKFYTFEKELIASHRDFDKFLIALKKGEKCAIVSGVNPSGTLHIGHKPLFDTNLFFQKKYGMPIFIPISDDETYLTGKTETQEKALKNAIELAKQFIAYGFDGKKTYIIIDQIYTDIYNLAIKLSKKINYSEIKATYGYKKEDNIGMHFYPAIQTAHILYPQEKYNIKNVLVPIGPDEDSHIRISRDIAMRAKYQKPSIIHLKFLPGTDGKKMSASKNNSIYFKDDKKTITKKINKAISGGQKTLEEHRKKGGNPKKDLACLYLSKLYLTEKETKSLFEKYEKGKITSGEIKKNLIKKVIKTTTDFQTKLKKITKNQIEKAIQRNE